MADQDTGKPYTDKGRFGNHWTRTFEPANLDEGELIWHRDEFDRTIVVVHGLGWQLQIENELPVTLTQDQEYFVRAKTYHRVIAGSTPLVLDITEHR